MKLKKYLTLGIGMIAGFGLSIAGLSYAAQNGSHKEKLITSEKAKSIMLGKVPGATISEFSYDGDDSIPKYDGTLIKDNYEYEVDIDAKTGEIIKFEKEKVSISNNSNQNTNSLITAENSTMATPNDSGNSNVSNNSSANSQSNQQSTTKPDSIQNSINNSTNSYIGEAKAKSIMLSKVPGATIKEFHLDNDSTPEYEAELVKGDIEYEISVDARTGAIKEFSKERIDKYDDRYDNDDDDDDRDDD